MPKKISQTSIPTLQLDLTRSATIRVALFKETSQVQVVSSGTIRVFDTATRKLLFSIGPSEDTQVVAQEDGIRINQHVLRSRALRLVPSENLPLKIKGRAYRGQLEIALNGNPDRFSVIEYLPLEDYVKGVIPNEMLASWPMEALRAQAVAARTFALYKMSGRTDQAYDLDATVNSQVYGGLDSEKASTNQAVETTQGVVAVYQGRLISAFYHSNCGGRTADVRDVWGSEIPYLAGSYCGFCDQGPHARWTTQLPKGEISSRLRKHSIEPGQELNLELSGRDPSGRIQVVKLCHRLGENEMKAALFRMAIGPDVIRSTNFFLRDEGSEILFSGRGWGHGVGLCQEGALGMAQAGYSYLDILHHYYPGIDIRRISP